MYIYIYIYLYIYIYIYIYTYTCFAIYSKFHIMSTFQVMTKGFLSKLAKLINQLMQPIATLLKCYNVMLFLLNYKLS